MEGHGSVGTQVPFVHHDQRCSAQVTACRSSNETWKVIEGNFTSAKRAHTVNSKIALALTKKEEMSVAEYVSKM
jgi:hypothetical protein